MPYVQVTLAKGRSPEQIRSLMAAISDAVHASIDVPVSSVRVWLNEVDEANMSVGGVPLPEVKARRAAGDRSL